MLLRSLTKHVKDQNWFAVALDFFIVVAGILIAFQITNWNEKQVEQRLERQYLERLRDDLTRSKLAAVESIETVQKQVDNQGVMIKALQACELNEATRTAFDEGLRTIGQTQPLSLVRGTLDELQSTGRMGLIRKLELRKAINDLLEDYEASAKLLEFIVARFSPQMAYVDRRMVIDLPDGIVTVVEYPVADISISYDFPVLCKDTHYVSAISANRLAIMVIARNENRRVQQYQKILLLLDAELEKK
jgi:Family of unknown function (DUF6090)